MTSPIEETMLRLLAEAPAGKSIDPASVARALDPEGWRRHLPQVRASAVGLARQGRVVILRHNKPVNPEKFRGVYRIRTRLEGDPTSFEDTVEGDETGDDATEA